MRKIRLHDHGDESSHGNRPWVFFMVDCFFLITEFFVLTFQFKQTGWSLEQKMPPGGIATPVARVDNVEAIPVHVRYGNGTPAYVMGGSELSAAGLEERLAAAASVDRERWIVRVSYDPEAQWGDVLAVFNACRKVKIKKCGLAAAH